MIKISEEKLKRILERIRATIETDDIEIKDCALLTISEELEDLLNKKGIDDQ